MEQDQQSNRGSTRVSHFINRRPGANFHHATRVSERIGLPLNHFITINFTSAGARPDLAVQLLQKMITQRFSPWLRRTAKTEMEVPPTYVWCMEAAAGQMSAHMLLHMPDCLMPEFTLRLHQWLSRLLGIEVISPSVLKIVSVYNLIGVRRYLLKGIDPAWAGHLGINPVNQGKVVGKRSGFSRNLGPVARKRVGYRPRRMPFTR
jgi:hypothetical protein